MKFNIEQMKIMKRNDSVIKFMVNNLIDRGLEEDNALEITFNSEVLNDSAMKISYEKCKIKN